MTGLERTLNFIKDNNTGRPPFHPIIMRWAAKYAGVRYRDFCLIPAAKTEAMIRCARDFSIDWVTVMSDPWAEASAFGIHIEYPADSLPVDTGGHLYDAEAASRLRKYKPLENLRCANRIEEIKLFRKNVGKELFIVGWIEGPVAEYVDLRRATNASTDFLTEPDFVEEAMDVILESAFDFIKLQLQAGAHCIGIGDAFCSQIGPELYRQFALPRQKKLVECVHSYGALAKLHICGDTGLLLEDMLETDADIIDIDHLVKSISGIASKLGKHQVLSGKSDPVTVIESGDEEKINNSVKSDFKDSDGRCIVSAGCEITPGTSIDQMRIFRQAAENLS